MTAALQLLSTRRENIVLMSRLLTIGGGGGGENGEDGNYLDIFGEDLLLFFIKNRLFLRKITISSKFHFFSPREI